MIVNKNIGIYGMEYFNKTLGVSGIWFDKISVQIIVSGVATKPYTLVHLDWLLK
jgi:hypothetical protein